jgi:hypothetical protein
VVELGFDDAGIRDVLLVLKDVEPAGKRKALDLIFPPDEPSTKT